MLSALTFHCKIKSGWHHTILLNSAHNNSITFTYILEGSACVLYNDIFTFFWTMTDHTSDFSAILDRDWGMHSSTDYDDHACWQTLPLSASWESGFGCLFLRLAAVFWVANYDGNEVTANDYRYISESQSLRMSWAWFPQQLIRALIADTINMNEICTPRNLLWTLYTLEGHWNL